MGSLLAAAPPTTADTVSVLLAALAKPGIRKHVMHSFHSRRHDLSLV
jgi:hypothetical protein